MKKSLAVFLTLSCLPVFGINITNYPDRSTILSADRFIVSSQAETNMYNVPYATLSNQLKTAISGPINTNIATTSNALVSAINSSSNVVIMAIDSSITSLSNNISTTSIYDSNALAYATSVGVVNPEDIQRLDGFVRQMKSYNLWSGMDGILLRTNFNVTFKTFAGAYATNYNGVARDGAGTHYDGSDDYTIVPSTVSPSFTMVYIFTGDPNPPNSQTPFGVFNKAGANNGAMYPYGNALPYNQMRLAMYSSSTFETSPVNQGNVTNGWFMSHGGTLVNNYGDTAYLFGTDPRQRFWAMTWDNNTQTPGSYIDCSPNFSPFGHTYTTTFSASSLDSIVLGAKLNPTGTAAGFAKVHIAAAFVFPSVLTSNQVWQVQRACQWLLPGDERIFAIGDSMTAFNGPISGNGKDASMFWPAVLYGADALGSKLGTPQYSEFTWHDMAISGVVAGYFTEDKIRSWYGSYAVGGPIKRAKCYVMVGINNIGLDKDGPSTFNEVSNVWWVAKNVLGASVTAFTLPGVSYSGGTNAGYGFYTNSPALSNLNAMIRSARGQWDDLVDAGLAFPASLMETNNNATPISTDGLHMNALGQTNLSAQIKQPFRIGQYNGTFTGTANLTELIVTTTNSIFNVTSNLNIGGWTKSTNGYMMHQLVYIPTNSIPASTSTITNYVLLNLTNIGPVFVATNIATAGSFIFATPTLTVAPWP